MSDTEKVTSLKQPLVNDNDSKKEILNKQKEEKAIKSYAQINKDGFRDANIFSKTFFHWAYNLIKLFDNAFF